MRHKRLLLALALALTACGGEGSEPEADSETQTSSEPGTTAPAPDETGEDSSDETVEGSSDEETATSDSDEADMPGPGEAVVEVDGNTYVFNTGECNIGEDGFGVTGSTDTGTERVQFEAFGNLVEGDFGGWSTLIAVQIDGEVAYTTQTGTDVDDPIFEGQTVLVEAEFSRIEGDDFSNVVPGRLLANCG